MKKRITKLVAISGILIALFCLSFATSNKHSDLSNSTTNNVNNVNWMSWTEAIAANAKSPKKIFVFIHTSWCGWCKNMNQNTFKSQSIIEYINANFYAVKLDAESKEDIIYKGYTFKHVERGRRGYHELAASLMDNRMSYPTMVTLDENEDRILIDPGFKDSTEMMPILTFIGDDFYKTTTFKDYKESVSK